MTTDNIFKLSFGTHIGKVLTLDIPRADATKTADDVILAMDDIIDSRMLVSSQGRANSRKDAKFITTTQKAFNITE